MPSSAAGELAEKAVLEKKNALGENRAFQELVKKFQNFVFGYIFAMIRDVEESRDITQEVFIKAYRHLDNLRMPDAFPGWIKSIAHRETLRMLKRRKNDPLLMENANNQSLLLISQENMIEKEDVRKKIRRQIENLPDIYRVPLILFYIKNSSIREIAKFLDIREQTVRKRLERARIFFRNDISAQLKESLDDFRPSRNSDLQKRLDFYVAFECTDKNARKDILEQMLQDGYSGEPDAVSRAVLHSFKKNSRQQNQDNSADLDKMLEAAAQEAQINLLEQMLSDGYDINGTDSSGRTLKHWAAQHRHRHMTDFIRKHQK